MVSPWLQWKTQIKTLIAMKEAMFHSLRTQRPTMLKQADIVNWPTIKIVRRPNLVIITIEVSAARAFIAPIIYVP